MSEPASLLRYAVLGLVLSGAIAFTGLALVGQGRTGAALPTDAGMPTFSDFEVRSGDATLRLSDLRDDVVVVYFGYAGCPDICPTTLSTVAAAFRALSPDQLAHTQGLFVSVDPERDTPEQAQAYASYFHPRLRGGTSDAATIAATAQDWGVRFARAEGASEAMGYTVDHTSIVFLVGPDGQMKKALPHGSDPEKLAAAIAALLPS